MFRKPVTEPQQTASNPNAKRERKALEPGAPSAHSRGHHDEPYPGSLLAFLLVELFLTSLTIFLSTIDLASMLFTSLSAASRTMYNRLEMFHSILSTV